MVLFDEVDIRKTGSVLLNKDRPLKERFRALFTLRNVGGDVAIECIKNCFTDDSVLLKHELAYCLGQMQDKKAVPVLIDVLSDMNQQPMVRHEAAEALGAIGSPDAIPLLEKCLKDPMPEVSETCEIALDRIKWLNSQNGSTDLSQNPYASVDPAPPASEKDIENLRLTLLDEKTTLFDRYRAMFALRNQSSKSAIDALGSALRNGESALFRHEVAFVFGQLQNPNSVSFLKESLEDDIEHEMVRHECAEALGAIATNECYEILNKYLSDNKRVVRESCEVALDMCEYENSPEFQYANTITDGQ